MAVVNPDAIYFQYLAAAGGSQISQGLPLTSTEWRVVNQNDIYLWSYMNRRTFWSFGEVASPIKVYQTVGPSADLVLYGFWSLAEGRVDIILTHDIEECTMDVKLYTNAAALIATASPSETVRAQGTSTFSAVASTATEGYFTVEVTPTATSQNALIYGFKLQEQRIALADL